MTTAQFIAAIEAKPQFIKWAKAPVSVETVGTVEKWNGLAYVSTPDGTNTVNVWFMVDGGQATWQTQDTLTPSANSDTVKLNALENYLKANFDAFFIGRTDLVNNWAEVDTYKLNAGSLKKQAVIVYQRGVNPISHLNVI